MGETGVKTSRVTHVLPCWVSASTNGGVVSRKHVRQVVSPGSWSSLGIP